MARPKKWQAGEEQFIHNNYDAISDKRLAKMMSKRFARPFTKRSVESKRQRLGLIKIKAPH